MAQPDAGVLFITQPAAPFCNGLNDVVVVVQNYGTDTIFTADIGWKVNNVDQTAFAYSDTLPGGESDTVLIGAFNFNSTVTYNLRAYTSNPNGGSDNDATNDTTDVFGLQTQLSGVYTIFGGSPDYTSIQGAVNDMYSRGICGAIVFNIRDGVYTEQDTFPEIPGASAANTITFQSENGDSSLVTITQPSSAAAANNFTFKLNGADYITFNQITIERSGNLNFGRVIEFTNNATNNIITNCSLNGGTNATVNSSAAIVYSGTGTPFNDSLNTFSNNLFNNGSIGIYMNGVGALSLEEGTVISNNSFINQTSKGIQMGFQAAARIDNNTFTTNSTYNLYAAIDGNLLQRNMTILRNKISNSPSRGIYLVDCTGLAGIHSIVSNNFIQCNDSTGISLVGGDFQDIVYNSVNITGGTASRAMAASSLTSGIVIRNNSFANNGGGYAYTVDDNTSVNFITSDYNNLYTSGANVGRFNGTNAATLADWQLASGRDTNSVSGDPLYVSSTDLHSNSTVMQNTGTPLFNVNSDIDGDSRDLLTPDIGADEYAPLIHTVHTTFMLSPVDNSCESNAVNVTVVIENDGSYAESGFPLTVLVDRGVDTVTINDVFAGVIIPGESDTITFSTTLDASGGGTYTFYAFTSLSGDQITLGDTLSSTVNIVANPVSPVAEGDTICGSGTGMLSGVAIDSLVWYDAATGGNIIGTGVSIVTPSVSGTTTFYVEEINTFGCISGRTAVDVVVNALPTVFLGQDTTIVNGTFITIDAGTGFAQYDWDNGEATQTIDVAGGTYCVTVTDGNGCTNSDCITVIEIFPNDVGIDALLSPINPSCEDDSTAITIQIKNYGSTTATDIPVTIEITGSFTGNYNDTLFGSLLAGGSAPLTLTNVLNTLGGGTYNFTIYTTDTNDVQSINDTLFTTVTISTYPTTPIGFGGLRCGPGIATITATSSDTLCWYADPIGGSPLACGNNYSDYYASTDTVYVQAGTVCLSSRVPVIVEIVALPSVFLGNDTIIPVGGNLVLDAGAGFSIYDWSTSEATQTITVDTIGFYSVIVTDSNGCSNSDTIFVNLNVGFSNNSTISGAVIYPNPSQGIVNLQIQSLTKGKGVLSVLNADGAEVYSESIQFNQITSKTLDLSSMAKGVYTLIIQNEDGRVIRKVVLQ